MKSCVKKKPVEMTGQYDLGMVIMTLVTILISVVIEIIGIKSVTIRGIPSFRLIL